jgi:uncharacterized protein YdhG (YjbR/CyaY superfamily)
MADRPTTVEEYIDSFPEPVRDRLRELRRIAVGTVPGAEERISYGIPAVTRDGRDVVFYSGWQRHVAIYPVPHGDEGLDRELDAYRAGKGTLQFRHDRPLPEDLVRRVVAALAGTRTTRPEPTKEPRP